LNFFQCFDAVGWVDKWVNWFVKKSAAVGTCLRRIIGGKIGQL